MTIHHGALTFGITLALLVIVLEAHPASRDGSASEPPASVGRFGPCEGRAWGATGTVVDAAGDPIDRVFVRHRADLIDTDPDGTFGICLSPQYSSQHRLTLTFEKEGYVTQTVIRPYSGPPTIIDVTLERS